MPARARGFFNPQDESVLARRLFWVAFGVRVLYVTLAHTYRIRLTDDHFQFGWEMGRIARALATGYGYSDPFVGHTGPTAWTPPLYPLILAEVFKVFGVYTPASAWVMLTINSVFSAATAPAVYEIARRGFGRSSDPPNLALWSGWMWALYPAAMQYAVRWVWDMSLTACLLSWAIVLAMRLRDTVESHSEASAASLQLTTDNWQLTTLFGLLWGLIALSNSSVLLFLPACGIWIVWPSLRMPRVLGQAARNGALAGIVFLAVITPWVARNYRVFHAFVPMRSNFGAELYESAQLSNYGFPEMATLPLAETSPQLQQYKRLGEVAYSRQQGARALAILRAHPRQFGENALRRVYFFWVSVPHPSADNPRLEVRTDLVEAGRVLNYAFVSFAGLLGLGLALYRRAPGAWLFFWAFALLPLVYYFVTVQARFRHPLEPLLCVLAVYVFQSAERGRVS